MPGRLLSTKFGYSVYMFEHLLCARHDLDTGFQSLVFLCTYYVCARRGIRMLVQGNSRQ